ncbi:F0F1 ATP synthase subunit B [Thermodesulfobacteriota bacterium]
MFSRHYRKSCIFSAVILIIFSLLIYGPAKAEETGHSSVNEAVHTSVNEADHGSGHAGDRSGDLLDLLYRFINFFLLVVILFVVIKKSPIKGFFAARSEEIRQKLEDLKNEKEETENRYQEVERQLKDFEAKRKDIIDQYRNEGMIEKDKIIAEANDRVKKIIDQSELTIQQEIQSAKNRLKQEVVELSAQKAKEIIAKEMGEKDQDNLIDEFIERVGKVN